MTDFPVIPLAPSDTIVSKPGRPMDSGRNAGTRTLTRAETDIDAVSGWLAKYTDNSNTFDAYRRDAERLLAWAGSKGKGLAELMTEDMVAYGAFLRDPQPIEDWCLVKEPRFQDDGTQNPEWHNVQRPPRFLVDGAPNPRWRPFVGALSPSAAGQSLTILFGMFEYLCGVGYLAGNPLRASRKRGAKPRRQSIERYLELDLWQFVLDHIETWPRETARQDARYHRTKFLAQFLQYTGLRRFELAKATTGDIQRKDGSFWLHVEGKGDIAENVPLSRAAMQLLGEYRASTGRPPLPDPTSTEPLLMDITGAGRPVSVKTIHAVLKELFHSALRACDSFHAKKLKAASAHWLRHTAATHALQQGYSLLETRDLLRHASVQTTEIYLHADDRQRHADLDRIQN